MAPPRVSVRSLLETLIFMAIRHFEFRDGNLGLGLSGESTGGGANRSNVEKRRIQEMWFGGSSTNIRQAPTGPAAGCYRTTWLL